MADEMDFLELVIASERVGRWLDVLHLATSRDRARCKVALLELADAVKSKPPYAEEARNAKAPSIVTGLLKMFEDDEEVSTAISDVISSCAGVLAASARVLEHDIDGLSIRIREGLLGDGVGTRVWAVATTLCRELSEYPNIVRGKQVLEIGSGCGLTGIFAAKLGAERVTLTDFLPKVLGIMTDNMHMNSSSQPNKQQDIDPMADDFDPEAELLAAYEADNMRARFLDWAEGTAYDDPAVHRDSILGEQAMSTDCEEEVPPQLEPGEQFPVIIGTDVIYEPLHAELVANILSRRLAPGGSCILCCGVRIKAVFDSFFHQVAAKGFRVWKETVHPTPRHGEVMGRECEYEGGFLLMFMDRESAPATWHRSDIFH